MNYSMFMLRIMIVYYVSIVTSDPAENMLCAAAYHHPFVDY